MWGRGSFGLVEKKERLYEIKVAATGGSDEDKKLPPSKGISS